MLAYIPLQLFSRAFFLNISATSDDVLTISKFMLCCYKLILAQLKGFSLQNLLLKLCAFFVYRTVIVLAFICACAFMLCMLHLLICRIYIEVVILTQSLDPCKLFSLIHCRCAFRIERRFQLLAIIFNYIDLLSYSY